MDIILIVIAALVISVVVGSLIGRALSEKTYTRVRQLPAPGSLDALNFQNVSPTRSWSAYGTQAQNVRRSAYDETELFV